MARIARLVVDAVAVAVYAPYEYRDVIKCFPGRRWNPQHKCWLVGASFADAMAEALKAAGCTVIVTRHGGAEDGAHRDHHVVGAGWAETLFAAVGPARAAAVYRALSRVLHPDAGGDTALMRELNAARDRQRCRGAA